jgi:hypothetical protein
MQNWNKKNITKRTKSRVKCTFGERYRSVETLKVIKK